MAKIVTDEDNERELFWNATAGVRPVEPISGLFEGICSKTQHIYDDFYGPEECARCGAHPGLSRQRRRTILIRKLQKARRLGRRI